MRSTSAKPWGEVWGELVNNGIAAEDGRILRALPDAPLHHLRTIVKQGNARIVLSSSWRLHTDRPRGPQGSYVSNLEDKSDRVRVLEARFQQFEQAHYPDEPPLLVISGFTPRVDDVAVGKENKGSSGVMRLLEIQRYISQTYMCDSCREQQNVILRKFNEYLIAADEDGTLTEPDCIQRAVLALNAIEESSVRTCECLQDSLEAIAILDDLTNPDLAGVLPAPGMFIPGDSRSGATPGGSHLKFASDEGCIVGDLLLCGCGEASLLPLLGSWVNPSAGLTRGDVERALAALSGRNDEREITTEIECQTERILGQLEAADPESLQRGSVNCALATRSREVARALAPAQHDKRRRRTITIFCEAVVPAIRKLAALLDRSSETTQSALQPRFSEGNSASRFVSQ